MHPDRWYQDYQDFDYRGHRVLYRYRRGGGRHPTLLVHGFPTASWDWHPIWDDLPGPLITFDMMGFGYSAKPSGYDYSLMDQADLAQALCSHLGVDRVHLLAHDYGDTVAQELLVRGAEGGLTIESCYLLNGGIIPGEHRAKPIQKLLAGPLGGLVAALMSESRFRKTFSDIFGPETQPGDRELNACWQLIEKHRGRRVMPALSRYQHERRRHRDRWVRGLAETSVPCRALIGSMDPISGAHMATALGRLCPNVELAELPRIGHYPQLEAPDQVLADYLAFRQRLSASPATDDSA
ncbi:MAG: alpha/beta hydrolase [Xanthomonadales bacterium]|nr:alpha/beta hydrolase [Xanthomonadales bacterium]